MIPLRPSQIPKATAFLALLCCAIAAFAAPPAAKPDQPPTLQRPDFTTLQQGQVTRILDEDTVLIRIGEKYQRYDLLGIAPLTTKESAAKAALADALSRIMLNETVLIQHDPGAQTTHSNRLHAYFYRHPDHLPINLELIRQGYSRFSQARMSIHTKVFSHYESRARDLERGIWSTPPLLPSESPNQEPNPNQDPDPDSDAAPETNPPVSPDTEPAIPDRVFVTKYGTKYHREGCTHLTPSARSVQRDEIDTTHKPCKTCKPDTP